MKWIFTGNSILEEASTRLSIQLLSGTWSEPRRVKIKAPKTMAKQDQTKYLRLGLAYAKEFMTNRYKFTAQYSAIL